MASKPNILMCPPTYFEVAYAINPWMSLEHPVDISLAQTQWDNLKQAIIDNGKADVVELIPTEGLPDMVFTANAAFVHQKTAVIARYKCVERQGEEPHVQTWFSGQGYKTVQPPKELPFEGAGDALKWTNSEGTTFVFSGYKPRTDIRSHSWISIATGLPVISLELIDPCYYHIDTCFCPLDTGEVIYYPGAFDAVGLAALEATIPESQRIIVSESEAAQFGCNAVSIHDTVILNQGSSQLESALRERGKNVVSVDLSEFIKAGGSAKCLTLRLT